MSQARFIVGDVFDVLASLEPGSVDLCVSSPPFLALRSYLPSDHPNKAKEIGSEATPGEFIDTMLDVVEACARVLAPHGSLVFELGDTYAGSGGAGGDYNEGGLRSGQAAYDGSMARGRSLVEGGDPSWRQGPTTFQGSGHRNGGGRGWPLDKSKVLIPQLFAIALAYGFNPLTGRQTDPWRVRNTVAWCLDGDTVVYARTPKGEGPTRLLHLAQNWQPGQWELWDGERWTNVLGWSTREATDAIEIEFRNGERISATREHEWPTQRGLVRTEDLTVGDVVPNVRLPEPERVMPAALPDVEIGWLLGTFLADGSFDSRGRIQIAGHVDEGPIRLARLRALAEAYDGTATSHEYGNEGTVVVRSPVLGAVIGRYVGGDNARNKCLNAPAWRRGNDFLWAVLDGYLDGDGHYDAKNDRWRVGFTDNGWLARDLRVLCARLGYRCRIKRSARAADPRGGQWAGAARFYHRGEIRMTMKRDLAPSGQIVALRPSKRRRFFDVGVEGEPHLFALGSGLLTHNCRPNPPVGRDGDKFRPATSFLTVACKARDRYWDGDAVRVPSDYDRPNLRGNGARNGEAPPGQRPNASDHTTNPAGAPLLDWWEIPTAPYKGAHYATYPPDLVVPIVKSMCPPKVCRTCGVPSVRLVEVGELVATESARMTAWDRGKLDAADGTLSRAEAQRAAGFVPNHQRDRTTTGWSDCGHNDWRPGVVLDPFAGSGTTLAVATGHGLDAIGVDLDERNAELAYERIGGLFLTIEHPVKPLGAHALGECSTSGIPNP